MEGKTGRRERGKEDEGKAEEEERKNKIIEVETVLISTISSAIPRIHCLQDTRIGYPMKSF